MRKRNHVIPVRLNARELRELEEQVEKSGLSREEFMRSLILGAQVHAKPCEHHPELLRKIAGLCNNANQLAHVANASGMASEQSVQEMLRLTKETYDLKKHVNFRYTEDGGASPYDYAKTPLAHDDLKIDINRLDDYELLSTEDILGE